jgi:ATP-dependent Clp protease ATP-binding subunit ClpC
LTEYLMGDAEQMIRFDMNEYIDSSAVQRLTGDYYNPEGQLTGKVRYRPFGVLLLDEIEKAHPKVHDLLLQVLDDGRLTDSLGRTVDFSNMIIIMTSNVGARQAATQLGFKTGQTDNKAVYRKAVENNS